MLSNYFLLSNPNYSTVVETDVTRVHRQSPCSMLMPIVTKNANALQIPARSLWTLFGGTVRDNFTKLQMKKKILLFFRNIGRL